MVEITTGFSHWRKIYYGIHGRNVHGKATEKQPLQWFYIELSACHARSMQVYWKHQQCIVLLEKSQTNFKYQEGKLFRNIKTL